jgi:hypothetical protein
LGRAKVKSGGWTSWLWEIRNFGFCGELWWILAFLPIRLGFYGESSEFSGTADAKFWLQSCGWIVVVRCKNVEISVVVNRRAEEAAERMMMAAYEKKARG